MSKMDNIQNKAGELAADLPRGVMVVAQPAMLSDLSALASQIKAIACDVDAALPLADISTASIVVIEVDPASRNTLERVDALRAQLPGIKVIAGLGNVDIATSRQLLRRGVSDIVALPFSLDELVTSIVDTAQTIEADADTEQTLAPFITVIKSIGGAGSTTVLTHLAAQMAHDQGDFGARLCDVQACEAGTAQLYWSMDDRS